MNTHFDKILNSLGSRRLNQHIPEWRTFLEFSYGYFLNCAILNPMVVEIGVLDGAQRLFYEGILGARYIGIDINRESGATIIGDSRLPSTVDRLRKELQDFPINLLFIDGLHTYAGVKSDYEMYGPLTENIIAIHDINTPKLTEKDTVEVPLFWDDLLQTNKRDTIITIQHYNPRPPEEFNGRQLGIGLILKEGTGAE